jgi:hypothetical protein
MDLQTHPPTARRKDSTSQSARLIRMSLALHLTTSHFPNSPTHHPTAHKRSRRLRPAGAPKIMVKKEPPSSPEIASSRPRPRRLDLSNNAPIAQSALTARPSAPLTSKESAGLAIKDLGVACLSPGFQTQDPTMQEQLARSMDVRERQRQIIEARNKNAGKSSTGEGEEYNPFKSIAKTPGTSRRKGPPPGLSITAPSHAQFANERVIQSAPLNQSFTGLQRTMQPLSRHVVNQPTSLSNTSHIHHVPANQTANRLPPISDVFAAENLGRHNYNSSPGHSSHSNHQPPLPSPGFPPQHAAAPPPPRPREYKSAEEAVQSMTGGREDLLPRLVHYGGHQPPTPPSPMPNKAGSSQTAAAASTSSDTHQHSTSRRRGRDEYERDMGTPPLGRQAETRTRVGPFGEGRDSPETQQRKKDEFITLCARAWDLFHS